MLEMLPGGPCDYKPGGNRGRTLTRDEGSVTGGTTRSCGIRGLSPGDEKTMETDLTRRLSDLPN